MIYGTVEGERAKGRSCLADHTYLLIIPPLSQAIHCSEWRPTPDDAHPFISNNFITPSLPFPRSLKAPISHPPLPSLRAMTALPSFVELMASLGLDNKKSSPPPAQELSSPAIVVSSEHEPTQEHISSRIRVVRYSPYSAPIVSVAAHHRSNLLIPTTCPPVSFPSKECFHAF